MNSRQGNMAWIALGCLMIVSIGGFTLASVSQNNLRLAGLLKNEIQLRWATHAALSAFANQLKMTPWDRRFYKTSKDKPEYTTTMTYRGRSLALWARDSVRSGTVQTGTTDVFARVADSDIVMGTYQRLRLTSNLATNPRILHVLRELTVRQDFQNEQVRERLLKDIEADEKAEANNGPEGDVYGRAIDVAAEKDSPPDQAATAAKSVASEVPLERKFQEIMAKAQGLLRSGSLVDTIACLGEAMAIASGSGSTQRTQRRMACELAMARAQYALGLTSPEPDRTQSLTQSSSLLDRLIQDLGPGCVGPTAAYLRAQVRMSQKTVRSASGRDQVREEASRELQATLAAIAPGQAFEGGCVPVSELVEQFVTSWALPVAYCDLFLKLITIPNLGDLPIPVLERLSLTNEDGSSVRSITLNGLVKPFMWLPDGSALLASVYGNGKTASTVTLMDRTGNVLQEFGDIHPSATKESGGITLTPKGDQIVFYGRANDEDIRSFWVQDLKGGPPRRILGPYKKKDDLWPDHDPIRFSSDGKWVSYLDPDGGVKTAESTAFIQGSPPGRSVFPLSEERVFTPGMLWVHPNQDVKANRLIVFAEAHDQKHPEWGRLVMVNPVTGASSRSPAFPKDFLPSVVIPNQNKSRLTILSTKENRFLTVDYSANGFASGFDVKTFADGPFGNRPGRGTGNVIYLAGSRDNPGLFRWDMDEGDPVRLPLPMETGPTPIHVLAEPVVR